MKIRPGKSVTLLELLIAIALMGIVVLAFSSIDLFSRHHVISSDRRAKLQNAVSYALEHMSKNVTQGTGNINQPPLELLSSQNGFRVRVDRKSPPTPADLSDDTWISYTLSGNTLTCSWDSETETLCTNIIPGISSGVMPESPVSGFYINLDDNKTTVEVGLVARHLPNSPSSVDNPQIAMKALLYARGSSAQ